MSNVMVTGAAGFIGHALLPSLESAGHTVHAAVRPGSVPPAWLTRAASTTVIEVDMAVAADVSATVRTLRPDAIINLAVSRSSDLDTARRVNIDGFGALIDTAESVGAHIVHLGSSTELTATDHSPPVGSLGVTKLDASRMMADRITSGRVVGCTLRPFLVHGPGESPHRLLPTAIRAAASGDTLPLTAPGAARDHVHINDVIDAILAALHTRLDEPQPIDICTGESTTNEELIDQVEQLVGLPINRRVGEFPMRPWDRPHWTGDPARMIDLIGRPPTPATAAIVDVIRSTTVSVVVPMYRTRETLHELHHRIIDAIPTHSPYEIIYVDDACDQGSGPAIDSLATGDPRITAVHHPRNLGQHHAIRTGLTATTGHAVIVLDADLQDPPEAIPTLLQRLQPGDVDAVFAGRRGTYEGRGRMISGHAFKWLLHQMAGTPADAGGYVAMTRPLVDQIIADPRSGPYLLASIARTRRPTTSVPVTRNRRAVGRSATGSTTRLRLATQALKAAATRTPTR